MAAMGYSSSIAFEVLSGSGGQAQAGSMVAEVMTRYGGRALASSVAVEVLARITVPKPFMNLPGTLPWTIPPNWKTGVTERLKWRTDVIASVIGTEQRRCLRVSPRLVIEAEYLTNGLYRQLLDAFLTGPASTLWQVPLWWERYDLDAVVVKNDQALYFDHAHTELQPGDILMIFSDAFTYECVTVSAVDANSHKVSLSNSTQASWDMRAVVYRTRQCRLTGSVKGTRHADRTFDIKLTFETTQNNDRPSYPPPNAESGTPLQIEFEPNFANDLSVEYARLYAEFDNETGTPLRRDLGLRAFHVHQFEYLAFGRQASDRFRGFLYWMQGKLREIYVPSYFCDVSLLSYAVAHAADDQVFVSFSGYSSYLGQNEPDRNALLFYFRDGTVGLDFVASTTYVGQDPYGNTVDQIRLSAPIGREISIATVWKVSYMMLMRQDQDDFDITHETDTRGGTRFTTTFRSVGPQRQAADYALTFTGAVAKDANPPVLVVDIARYTAPVADPLPPLPPLETPYSTFEGGGSDTAGEGNNAGQGPGAGGGGTDGGGTQL